jgi:hypothetical protein
MSIIKEVRFHKCQYASRRPRRKCRSTREFYLTDSFSLQEYVKAFSEEMRKFLGSAQDESATQAFNSKSWDGLEKEAAAALGALEEHEQRRRNWRNPFEAADKVGGAVARRIEFLVELVPDGDYTGLLAGGLRLLCNVSDPNTDHGCGRTPGLT